MGFDSGWLVKATFEARAGQYAIVNTVHYNGNGTILDDVASIQALADRLNVDVIPKFTALFRSGWTIQPVVVTEEKDPLNPDEVRTAKTAGSGGPGTRTSPTGDELPLFCCRVYKLTTGKVGRSFRGRMFVGGVTYETDQAGGAWLTPAASNFAFLADAYVNSFPLAPDLVFGPSTATVKWCVYSPTRRARGLDDYANDVVAKVPRPDVHSLRSRATY